MQLYQQIVSDTLPQRLLLLCLLSTFSATAQVTAQASKSTHQPAPLQRVTLPDTEIRHLRSRRVNKGYKLYVSLPTNYQSSKKSYPTVYLLDADYSFALAKNITDHIIERNQMPEMIVVGIAYDGLPQYRLNRTRDYTPTFSPGDSYGPEYGKHSGGGPKFREFLQTELIPFMEANYRVNTERTLAGHSFGGLFTTWVAFTKPELFSNYIAVSPSLWYDKYLMFRVEQEFASYNTKLPIKMFLSVGAREINEQRNMVTDLNRFAEQIRSRNYQGLSLQTITFDDETHNSVFPAAFTKGIRFICPTN